jgi:hypothetical protein
MIWPWEEVGLELKNFNCLQRGISLYMRESLEEKHRMYVSQMKGVNSKISQENPSPYHVYFLHICFKNICHRDTGKAVFSWDTEIGKKR